VVGEDGAHPGPLGAKAADLVGLQVPEHLFDVFVGVGFERLCEVPGDADVIDDDARMFALSAIRFAPPERIPRYIKYIKKLAPPQARPHLETLMKTVLKDAFVDGWFDQGRLEEAQENLLQLLEVKFALSEEIRKRVEECADLTKVKTWFTRAISAKSICEVFAD
jgi:hypothetical protein